MIDYCTNCAIGLFNTKHHNLQGVGNPWNGNCIVVPNVDYGAYKQGDMSFSKQVEIIKDVLLSSTGVDLSDIYVIPLIRCNEKISCKLDKVSYNRCLHYFANDVRQYNFKNILLLGDAARRFLKCDITENLNNLFISKNGRRYVVNYSPFIKHIDQDKFEVFKQSLIKWYNAITTKLYDYDLYML